MPDPFDLTSLDLAPDSEVLKLKAALKGCQALKYRDQELLIQQQESSQDIFLVLKGGLVVEQRGPNAAHPALVQLAAIACSIENPAFLGEMAYLGSQARSASVRSTGASYCIKLRPQDLETIIQDFPFLTQILCKQFSQRLKETNDLLVKLQTKFNLNARSRMYMPEEVVYSKGETADTLFQVVTGCVRLEADEGNTEDKRENTSLCRPQDLPKGFLGLLPYLHAGTHHESAIAEEPSFLVAIDKASTEAFIRCHPDLALAVCRFPRG